jgi:hypothetical protein
MKKFIVFFSILALFTACGDAPQKAEAVSEDKPLLTLADFNAEAGNWIDKEIQIQGIVDHVCKHGGKRLFLVDDFGDVHIDGEERFDDALTGSQILVTGIIRELRIDEAYCLQMEADHIQKHKEGVDSKDVYESKMKHIQQYRDSMQSAGVDHLSFYNIDYVSHEIK